jgi:hypothetical protein
MAVSQNSPLNMWGESHEEKNVKKSLPVNIGQLLMSAA